ncbi:hypothetical protein a10_07901 [Streptomyces acidiscabies]|nr:hypothetical protein a10_07901 [Streptomyces acidiscabies]GAV44527.1 hypothetical protein Saa2_07497 [Streptomyces acidiscabies]
MPSHPYRALVLGSCAAASLLLLAVALVFSVSHPTVTRRYSPPNASPLGLPPEHRLPPLDSRPYPSPGPG